MTKRRPPDRQTILIADDSEIKRAIPADMLGKECEIIEAANGMRALETIRERNMEIDLMLLDIIMPELDGFKVLEAMNQWRWIVSIPVIMISAESGTSFAERAYELGVSDYISRPFDALIVRRRVVNTLMLYAKQKLMPEEFEVMKNHATVGAAMLKALPAYQDEALVKVAYEICRWHHRGMTGGAIPMACGAKTFRSPPRLYPWRTSMTR